MSRITERVVNCYRNQLLVAFKNQQITINRAVARRVHNHNHAKADHKYRRDESLPAWHGWHAFRRGLGTNLKRLGVDLKTIQEILRHAHIATTADIYVKEISEQAVEAMQRLEDRLDFELEKDSGKTEQNRLNLQ